MKVAFLGAYGSFDYFRIGGMESLTRRLTAGLMAQGHQADFVLYGAPAAQSLVAGLGIGVYYCTNLQEALSTIARKHDQVVAIYLRPRDRLSYLHFWRVNRRRLRFHQLFASWPEAALKRRAAFLEARLYPVNGRLFCLSPRIYEYVNTWSQRALLLLPPVPEQYFLRPEDKPHEGKLRITYIGRTEAGKGISDVIDLFTRLQGHPEIDLELQGFHHGHVKDAVRTHQWLERQQDIRYFYTPFASYSPEVDKRLRAVLKRTDILLLPYRRLSSTMDTPLLLLEGMASLCAVLTRPLGDIPRIYGPSPFLVSGAENMRDTVHRVLKDRNLLDEERQRIMRQNESLGFGLDKIINQFIDSLN